MGRAEHNGAGFEARGNGGFVLEGVECLRTRAG